jgi:hypothetical protein
VVISTVRSICRSTSRRCSLGPSGAQAGRPHRDHRRGGRGPALPRRPGRAGRLGGLHRRGLVQGEYEAGLAAAGFERVSVAFTHQVGDGLHSAIIKAAKPTVADPATTVTAPAREPCCRWRLTPAAADQPQSVAPGRYLMPPKAASAEGRLEGAAAPSPKGGLAMVMRAAAGSHRSGKPSQPVVRPGGDITALRITAWR